MNPLYAQTLLIGTTPVQVFPTADGVNHVPINGILLRVPANYGGSANSLTALWSNTSANASSGIDVAKGDSGTVADTLIRAEALKDGQKVWVVGSSANTPVAVTIQ